MRREVQRSEIITVGWNVEVLVLRVAAGRVVSGSRNLDCPNFGPEDESVCFALQLFALLRKVQSGKIVQSAVTTSFLSNPICFLPSP